MQSKKHHKEFLAAQTMRKDEYFITTLIGSLPGIFYVLAANTQFVMWNDYLRDVIMGKSESEMASISALEVIHQDDRLYLQEKIRDVIISGFEEWVEVRVLLRGGPEFLWFLLRGKCVFFDHVPYLMGLGSDITKLKRSENRQIRLNRTLLMLSKCNEIILHAQEEVKLLDALCHIIVEIGSYRMALVCYAELDKAKSVKPVAQAGFDEGYREKLMVSWANIDRGLGPTGTAIRTGKPSLTRDVKNDPHFEPWRMDAIKNGYASIQGLPLKTDNKVFGAVTVYSAYPDAFDEMETELLTTLADNLAYGIMVLRAGKTHRLGEEKLLQSEKRYRSLFQNHHTVMLITDPQDGKIVDANPAAAKFYGWPREKLYRMYIQEINTLPPAETMAAMEQTRSGEKSHFLFRHRRANGSIRAVEVFCNRVKIAGRDLLYSIIHDVTERKQYETATAFRLFLILKVATHSIEELLQATLDEAERLTESSFGFFLFVGEDQAEVSLQACSSKTKKSMEDVADDAHYGFDNTRGVDEALRSRKAVIQNDHEALKDRKGMEIGDINVNCEVVVPVLREEKVVAILMVCNKLSDYYEDDVKWVTLLADIAWDVVDKKIADDENEILREQQYVIENLAMHDSLTGLPNRRLLADRINQTLALVQRNNTMAALMIFDLDNFKTVNDTFGHGTGDSLLQQVATRTLKVLLRSGDSLARIGGDEFVVLLPQITTIAHAVAIAEKILQTIKTPFSIDSHAINISCSIGVAVFPNHGKDELTLMKHADDAMYKSKSDGKNRIAVYEADQQG
ncbi:MAG: diguanylate cyclase [Chlorobiaceae bacterium]|nr:diguanylate cyclase [Chlorobiaceae bacterium]